MGEDLRLILEGGALVLLGYIIIWATKTGFPSLVGSVREVAEAIDKNTDSLKDNTSRLESIERRQMEQTSAILQFIEHGSLRDETLDSLRNQDRP